MQTDELEVYSDPVSSGAQADYRTKTVLDQSASVPLILGGAVLAEFPVRDLVE